MTAGQHQFHFCYDLVSVMFSTDYSNRKVFFWQGVFEWYFWSDWAANSLPRVSRGLQRSFYFFHKTGQIYPLLTLVLIAATFLCIAETGLNDFQLISLPPGYWFSFRRRPSSKHGPLNSLGYVSDHGCMKPSRYREAIRSHPN